MTTQASIQPTPRNAVLGLLADTLAATYAPQRTQQMQGLAKFFGLPAMSNVANELSYGGSLTTGKGQTTKLKPDAESVLTDVLSNMTPGSKAVAGAGVIVPAWAAKKSMKDIKSAINLIDAGKVEDAWKAHGVYMDPVDNILKAVIPDTGARIKTEAMRREGSSSGAMPSGPYQWVMAPDNATVGSVLSHPQLKALVPEVFDYRLVRDPSIQGGFFNPGTQTIGLGATNKESDSLSILLHEIQHGLQNKYDMSPGGNSDMFYADKKSFEAANKSLLDMMTNAPEAVPASVVATLPGYVRQFASARDAASRKYLSIAGEREARTVEKQLTTGDYTTYPLDMLPDTGPTIDVTKPYQKVDENPVLKSIIEFFTGKAQP